MVVFIFGIVVSLFVAIFLLLLCVGKKKKKEVEAVKYSQTARLNDVVDQELGQPRTDSLNSQSQNVLATNGNEGRRSHSASQASRELPQPPPNGEDAASNHASRSQRNSVDCMAGFASEASGDSVDTKHASPKGRRLPTPPPEGALKSINKEENDLQDDEDMYARVDNEQKKQEPVRLKIKTLDIKEGSGDSSFYAKVTDPTEDDTGLYAQVDDKGLEAVSEGDEGKEESAASTSTAAPKYTIPEYASVDKLKKGVSVKRKSDSKEPSAPPIPERNFDSEDGLEENTDREEEEETRQRNETETAKAPMYDKLCVRESLDHIRLRQEVEEERKLRYANLPRVNDDTNPGDVYAQIDETNPEAVYESLSQTGSADGTFQPNSSTGAGYSSIRELNALNHADDASQSDGSGPADLQARPTMQHHYEQIERPLATEF